MPAPIRTQVFSGTLVTQGTARGRVMATGERSALGRIGHSLAGISQRGHARSSGDARIVNWVAGVGLTLACRAGHRLVGDARRLAARPAGRPDAGDGHPARGTAGGADAVPGPGRVAAGAREGAGAQHPGRRTAGRDDRAVRRQDRHARRQPHGGPPAVDGTRRLRHGLQPAPRRCRRRCTTCSSSPCWPATAAPSTRWRRPSARRDSACWPAPSTCMPTGRWSTTTRCRARCWRCRACGSRPTSADRLIAAKGAPEAIVDLCHLDAARHARHCPAGRATWPATGLRVLGVARAVFDAGDAARQPARLRLRVPRSRRAGGPGAARRAAGHRRMPGRGHPGGDDDRRPSATALSVARQVGLRRRRRCHHRRRTRPDWTTPDCARAWPTPTSSAASSPSRSCAWCRRSGPAATSWR